MSSGMDSNRLLRAALTTSVAVLITVLLLLVAFAMLSVLCTAYIIFRRKSGPRTQRRLPWSTLGIASCQRTRILDITQIPQTPVASHPGPRIAHGVLSILRGYMTDVVEHPLQSAQHLRPLCALRTSSATVLGHLLVRSTPLYLPSWSRPSLPHFVQLRQLRACRGIMKRSYRNWSRSESVSTSYSRRRVTARSSGAR